MQTVSTCLIGNNAHDIENVNYKDLCWNLITRNKVDPTCVSKWMELYPEFENAYTNVLAKM